MAGSLLSIPVAFGVSLVGWRRSDGRAYAAMGMVISVSTAVVGFRVHAWEIFLAIC
jgi:hypothetical protein